MSRRKERVTLSSLLFASAAAFVLSMGGRVAAMDPVAVTACGQEFAGAGYLTGDLECTGIAGPAIVITGKGSLDFRGFSVTGGDVGIICLQSCMVNGPGTLRRPVNAGIGAAGALAVNRLLITDSGGDGLVGYRQVRVLDSVLQGNGGSGVRSQRVVIRGSVITGNGKFGAVSGLKRRVVLRDSQVTGNGLADECALGAACADLASGLKPRLRHSTCDTSWDSTSLSGGDWKVCLND